VGESEDAASAFQWLVIHPTLGNKADGVNAESLTALSMDLPSHSRMIPPDRKGHHHGWPFCLLASGPRVGGPDPKAQAPAGSQGWRHLVQRASAADPAPTLVGRPE
jgi:hypothetical protein